MLNKPPCLSSLQDLSGWSCFSLNNQEGPQFRSSCNSIQWLCTIGRKTRSSSKFRSFYIFKFNDLYCCYKIFFSLWFWSILDNNLLICTNYYWLTNGRRQMIQILNTFRMQVNPRQWTPVYGKLCQKAKVI